MAKCNAGLILAKAASPVSFAVQFTMKSKDVSQPCLFRGARFSFVSARVVAFCLTLFHRLVQVTVCDDCNLLRLAKKNWSHAHAPSWEFSGLDGIIPSLL